MSTKKYVEITASVAVEHSLSSRLDLLMGLHPEEKRQLTEDEEAHCITSLLRFVKLSEIVKSQDQYVDSRTAVLWLKYFPELMELSRLDRPDIYRPLWEVTLKDVQILHLAYAFYPEGLSNLEKEREMRRAANNLQREIDRSLADDPLAKGKITWTFPFPAECSLGDIIEQKTGLSYDLKSKLGLTSYSPGLICNYLLSRCIPLENIVNPYQFEDLTGLLFKEEGWDVELTSKSRDGGKDVIARRTDAGMPFVAYVQAKRNRKSHKVSISEVKEFVATVAADNVNAGYFVTTSYFSKPATQWLQDKGHRLATVELIDRGKLIEKVQRIADSDVAVYLKK
jgi:Restriction endonuclease